jgi:hypothetical protein
MRGLLRRPGITHVSIAAAALATAVALVAAPSAGARPAGASLTAAGHPLEKMTI